MKPDIDDTIVAVSTPLGEGAIGIVRLSGPRALEIADEIFASRGGKKPSTYATYTTHYGHVVQKTENRKQKTEKNIDEVILTVMRAPKSYTREDIVEINCHGGPAAMKKVLELVVKLGARPAEPGEFTKRAFLNGRIDLTQAEAVLDIIRAKTDASLRVAVDHLEGEFSKRVNTVIEKILNLLSHVEAAIDFPDEEIEIFKEADAAKILNEIKKDIVELLETADGGIILREGILATICGRPNVGKSSLMNLLLKRERVIVTPIPGTTRDAVEETINLKGFPIRLADTAGISDTEDILDKVSVERSRLYLNKADMVLFVLDGSFPIEDEDRAIIDTIKGKKVLAVINKIDLPQRMDDNDVKRALDTEFIAKISILERKNIELLEKEMIRLLLHGKVFQNEGAVVTNIRHKKALEDSLGHVRQALGSLEGRMSGEFIAQDLREAAYHLGLIIGRSVSDEILDRIFGEFCVGK